MKAIFISLILSLICAGILHAQSPWVNGDEKSTITLDWDRPAINTDNWGNNIRSLSSVVFLTGRFKANDRFLLVIDLPISHFGVKSTPYSNANTKTSIGNIYLGGELNVSPRDWEHRSYLEFGVRLPIVADDGSGYGGVTGLLSENDRKEAFLPQTTIIPVIGNFIANLNRSFALKFRLGGIYDIYTDKKYWGDSQNDLFLLYGVTGLLLNPAFDAQLEFTGRNHLAGNDPNFDKSGFTQVRAGVSKSFNDFTPGLYVRVPLGNNYRDFIRWAIGVTMKISF